MKFYNYLNENNWNSFNWSKFIKDCEPFLIDWVNLKGGINLYSGRKKETQDIVIKKIRKDRKPLDTPTYLHNLLNKEFKKKFGVAVRSEGLFCYVGTYTNTKSFGSTYVIFPIGNKYQFIYNTKISDLTSTMADVLGDFPAWKQSGFVYNWSPLQAQEFFDYINKYDIIYINLNNHSISDKKTQDNDIDVYSDDIVDHMKKNIFDIVNTYQTTTRLINLTYLHSNECTLIANEVYMFKMDRYNHLDFYNSVVRGLS